MNQNFQRITGSRKLHKVAECFITMISFLGASFATNRPDDQSYVNKASLHESSQLANTKWVGGVSQLIEINGSLPYFWSVKRFVVGSSPLK